MCHKLFLIEKPGELLRLVATFTDISRGPISASSRARPHPVVASQSLIALQDFKDPVVLLLIRQKGRLAAGTDGGVLQVE